MANAEKCGARRVRQRLQAVWGVLLIGTGVLAVLMPGVAALAARPDADLHQRSETPEASTTRAVPGVWTGSLSTAP